MTILDIIKTIETKCDQLKTTLIHKNADYGSSCFTTPALTPNVKPTTALMVRMSDKIARINNLQKNDAPNFESVEDSVMDLAGYCILLLVAMEQEKNSNEENF